MKPELKSLRDACIQDWCLQSHQVPTWLLKHRPHLIKYCQSLPVHGLSSRWLLPIQQLRAALKAGALQPNLQAQATIRADTQSPIANDLDLMAHLQNLKPWRKGPWQLKDIHIKSEWNSALKYQRLRDYGPELQGKCILDVGCGNGYYGFRMLTDGARYVLGVDPAPLFWAQFCTFQSFNPHLGLDVLPMSGEALENLQLKFQIVLSMGVLYHRKNPFEHLQLLRNCLEQGGALVLETLVIDAPDHAFLMPRKTYAGMSNIWGLPSVGLLKQWLQMSGFHEVECVSLALTRTDEQQQTPWIETQSLDEFLAPDGLSTKEGLPPPWRAIIRAKRL